METKHTPTPWKLDNEARTVVGADGIQICTPHGLRNPQPQVNAAFIVRAVNAHEELLAACKTALTVLIDIQNRENKSSAHGQRVAADCEDAIKATEQAIAKAEGK